MTCRWETELQVFWQESVITRNVWGRQCAVSSGVTNAAVPSTQEGLWGERTVKSDDLIEVTKGENWR